MSSWLPEILLNPDTAAPIDCEPLKPGDDIEIILQLKDFLEALGKTKHRLENNGFIVKFAFNFEKAIYGFRVFRARAKEGNREDYAAKIKARAGRQLIQKVE